MLSSAKKNFLTTWLSLGLRTCLTESLESLGILAYNEIKFSRVFGTLSLEVTNTPGTAKFPGSNLIRSCFFYTKIIQFQNDVVLFSVCLCFFDLFATIVNFFVDLLVELFAVFSFDYSCFCVFIYSCNLQLASYILIFSYFLPLNNFSA